MTLKPSPRIADFVDEQRLWRRHMDMAAIGAIGTDGVNRQALSREDIAARCMLIEWAHRRGYRVETDSIANLFVVRPGRNNTLSAVATGSHIDSQPSGGRFDGIYGVLAGFEALECLDDAGVETDRPIAVVAWTNEEGSRFAPSTMGSSVFAGARQLDDFLNVTDSGGAPLHAALATTLDSMAVDATYTVAPPLKAYIEAHIEQGPVLEARGIDIGVVTGIQGVRWFEIEITGRSAHAGTTPKANRSDAMAAAIDAINRVRLAIEDGDERTRFTIGRMEVVPNSPNTIAEIVRFTIDLRHPDAVELETYANAIRSICDAGAGPCGISCRELLSQPPCSFPELMVDTVESAATSLSLSTIRLPSGAMHDALFLASICPTSMIFVPCRNGVSHNPAEFAEPSHLANGARVLVETLVKLANNEQ
jgi:N-carbamoyl-L-amino-acid hydrolase